MKSILSWFVLIVSIALLVSSCASSDDGSTGSTGATGGSGGSGSLAYMTGTPAATGTQGTAYSFTPTITNTANDNISFSMLNQPSWMNVDNSTGVISGTPGSIVVGTTATDLFYMLEGPRHINGRNFSVSVTASEINATSISANERLTCALDNSSGIVKCWGWNNNGQLGLGDGNNRGDGANEMGSNLAFVELGTGRTATAIVAGVGHTCALLDNASVKCWGIGSYGRLGQGNTNNLGDGANEMGDNLPAIDLGTGRTATAIALGYDHTCALLDNASVKCWGRNFYGNLGQGNSATLGDGLNEMGDNLPAVDLGTGRTATEIAAGNRSTCAVLDNGFVKCWGHNNAGQLGQGNIDTLGNGANEMGDNLPAIDLGTGRTATAIAAGQKHTCALLDNASVKCWGYNAFGQLGQGNTNNLGDGANEMGDNLTIVDLGTGRTATAISTNGNHTCALLDNASVKCWGSNVYGQLGQGNTNNLGDGANEMGDNLPAIDLGTGRTATAISASIAENTCALLDNSAVKCWGVNDRGQLGQGNIDTLGNDSNEMGDNLPAIDL